MISGDHLVQEPHNWDLILGSPKQDVLASPVSGVSNPMEETTPLGLDKPRPPIGASISDLE